MNQKIAFQRGKCALCDEKFTDYSDVVPDHINRAEWMAPGGTTTRITFRLFTSGATERRDPHESERGEVLEKHG